MRPVRLVIQAFGPYAGRQVVDFRNAVESGLFGIYGQTGSGKSTIFSAITFALFGEASRAEQDTKSLRSDHADPSLVTEVEFVFDVGARRYVLRRRPEQTRPKQRGAGETGMPHEAWLFDATGIAAEEIDETNSGKPLAERKTGMVLEAVTGLLGYGASQFRQIVLLPQGRFEAFLAAKTDTRLEILRELFDVSLYRQIAARFKSEAAEAERSIREQRMVCEGRLRSEGFAGFEALAEGITLAETLHAQRLAEEATHRQQADTTRLALAEARSVEQRFGDARAAEERLAALESRAPAMAQVEDRLQAALRAERLADTDGHAIQAEQDRAGSEAHAAATRQQAQATQDAARHATQNLETERTRGEETDKLRREVEAIDRHRDTLLAAGTLRQEADACERSSRASIAALEAARKGLERLDEKKRLADQRFLAVQAAETTRQKLLQARAELALELAAAETFEKAGRDAETARLDHDGAQTHWQARQSEASDAGAALAEAEAQMSEAQALHLATRLVPGAPCPVCGSTHHPAPASGDAAHSGLDSLLRAARAALETARKREAEAAGQLAAATATHHERLARLSALSQPAQPATVLRATIEDLKTQVDALGDPVDIDAARAFVDDLAAKITMEAAGLEDQRNKAEADRLQAAAAAVRLASALSAIPTDLQDISRLNAVHAASMTRFTARQQALAQAEAQERQAREAALTTAEMARAAEAEFTRAAARAAQARQTFESRLASEAMSEEEYRRAAPLVACIAADRTALETYRSDLTVARAQVAAARRIIDSLARPDLPGLETALIQAEALLSNASQVRADAQSHFSHLTRLRGELAAAFAALEVADAETAPLRTLAALFNADNPQRLDLETYAIGAMFDLVLSAANHRLEPMTRGRYSLEREHEGAGRARRGLGIRVFDLHTGKARPTATLSGGETFIAALSLALGLADVVESASGKVRLDTVFIDEGFGSLDTENGSGTLDQVLQVLSSLAGTSRAIGLISHVPLVQEVVPNGFYVRRDADGSHIETRETL